MEPKYTITASHLSKSFKNGEDALKDISITLKPGEILGFLGPSGAGKTTTIKILTGQLRQTSGEAQILNRDTRKINESIYEQIGILTDQSGVYERLSIYDNLNYFAKILQVEKSRINDLLRKVGLYEHRKKPAGKLSKGQAQRLILARAILHRPKLLFLDEPTSGLDPSTALEIHNLLLELKKEGMSIFLTTHNMEEASKLCDQIALLHVGHIVEMGTLQEICLKYNKEKTYRLLLTDGTTTTLTHTAEHIDQIHTWMMENRIETLHSCEPSLEDVFLAVTGRTLQ